MRSWGERVDQSRSFQFYCYNFGAFSPCENPLHPNISMYILHSGAPIIIQSSSNPSSRKNLDVRPNDRTTVQGATFDMRGQLYRGHANATALFSSPVVSALGSKSDDPGSGPGRGKALCSWDVWEKKMRGLAKSIYYCSLYMSSGFDEENLFNNQRLH